MTPLERHDARPVEQHQEALADLDRQIEAIEDAIQIGRQQSNPHQSAPFCAYCDKRWPCEPRQIAGVLPAALRGLEGRKRILLRHLPFVSRAGWACRRCSGGTGRRLIPAPWPCPDWRDAAGTEPS